MAKVNILTQPNSALINWIRIIEKSDLSTEIASETDQNFDQTVEDDVATGPPFVPPVDPDAATLEDLADIKKRPHRTICGKFDECKYNWAKKFVV